MTRILGRGVFRAFRFAVYLPLVLLVVIFTAPLLAQLPTQSSGALITPTLWNNVINAINVLYGGTAGQVMKSNGSGVIGSYQNLNITAYAVTVTTVSNTTSRTTTLQWSVPANAWADGDWMLLTAVGAEKNTSGSDKLATFGFTAGAGSAADFGVLESWNNGLNATGPRAFYFVRSGSIVYGLTGLPVGAFTTGGRPVTDASSGDQVKSSTPSNFTSTVAMKVNITFDGANSNTSYTPASARVMHFKN